MMVGRRRGSLDVGARGRQRGDGGWGGVRFVSNRRKRGGDI